MNEHRTNEHDKRALVMADIEAMRRPRRVRYRYQRRLSALLVRLLYTLTTLLLVGHIFHSLSASIAFLFVVLALLYSLWIE